MYFSSLFLFCRKSRLGIHTRTSPKRHQSNYPYLHKMRTYSPTQATSPSNLSVESTFSTSSTLPVNQYGSLHQASPGGLKLDLGSINFSSSLDSEDMENDIGIRLQDIVTEKGLQNGRNMKLISHNNYKSNSINIISNGNNKNDNSNHIIGSNNNNIKSNDNNDSNNKNDIDDNMDQIIDTDIDVNIDRSGMNCSAGIVKGISLLNPFKSTPYGRLPINDNDTENI